MVWADGGLCRVSHRAGNNVGDQHASGLWRLEPPRYQPIIKFKFIVFLSVLFLWAVVVTIGLNQCLSYCHQALPDSTTLYVSYPWDPIKSRGSGSRSFSTMANVRVVMLVAHRLRSFVCLMVQFQEMFASISRCEVLGVKSRLWL